MNEIITSFDFSSVPETIRNEAIETHLEVKMAARRAGAEVLALARALAKMQKLLEGRFMAWVEAECPFSYRQAHRYISVLNEFDAVDFSSTDERLGVSVLQLIAAPSTPEPVKVEAKAKIEAGEMVTIADVEDMKRRHAAEVKRLEAEATAAKEETKKAKATAKEKTTKASARQSESKSVADTFIKENERLRGEIDTLRSELASERGKRAPMESDIEDRQMQRLIEAWEAASDAVRRDFQRRVSVVIPFRQGAA